MKSIEEYEVNKLKNEDGYSCFHGFVQLPGHSSKTVLMLLLADSVNASQSMCFEAACFIHWPQIFVLRQDARRNTKAISIEIQSELGI